MSVDTLLTSLLIGLALLVMGCKAPTQTGPGPIQLIEQGALLVDVRSNGEFASGSLKGAIHIPHDQAEARLAEFGSKDQPVVVFCARGGRAGLVKSMLESKGWTQVHNGGGIGDLR